MTESDSNHNSIEDLIDSNDAEDVAAIGEEIEATPTMNRVASPLEDEVLSILNEKGISFQEMSASHVKFRRTGSDTPSYRREFSLPRNCLSDLAEQLKWSTIDHPNYRGYVSPSTGFAELLFQPRRRSSTDQILARIEQLSANVDISCTHPNYGDLKAVTFTSKRRLIGTSEELLIESPRLHFSGSSGRPCIEVSNASPLALVFHSSEVSVAGRQYFVGSIKIFVERQISKDELIALAESASNALLYEFDVRNGLIFALTRRDPPEGYRLSRARRRQRAEKARYPLTNIRPEVAALFNFASSATGNPPLSFLSYYQALEYFIPAAVRRSSISSLRREFRDPFFDPSNDDSLLRLLGIAERSATSSEAVQFRTLITDSVRPDSISSFLEKDWGDHFTRKGPIEGVAHLDPRNQKSILEQVADRIYQIRNRIVHAKDDPKYGEARVLLPESLEADSLWPDVELVRLLATEVVMDLS